MLFLSSICKNVHYILFHVHHRFIVITNVSVFFQLLFTEKNENLCSCENCLIKKIRLERKDPSDTVKRFLV